MNSSSKKKSISHVQCIHPTTLQTINQMYKFGKDIKFKYIINTQSIICKGTLSWIHVDSLQRWLETYFRFEVILVQGDTFEIIYLLVTCAFSPEHANGVIILILQVFKFTSILRAQQKNNALELSFMCLLEGFHVISQNSYSIQLFLCVLVSVYIHNCYWHLQ